MVRLIEWIEGQHVKWQINHCREHVWNESIDGVSLYCEFCPARKPFKE